MRKPAEHSMMKILLFLCLSTLMVSCSKKVGPRYDHLEKLSGSVIQRWARKTRTVILSGTSPVEYSAPVLSRDKVVVGGRELGIGVFDAETGSEIWKKSWPEGVDATPTLDSGSIYLGTNHGIFVSMNEKTGELQWSQDLKARVAGQARVAGGRVFVLSTDQRLHAFDAKTGKVLWSHKRNLPSASLLQAMTVKGDSRPTVHQSRVFVGFGDGVLGAFRATDGAKLWERKLSGRGKFLDVDASPVVVKGFLYAPSYDGALYKISPINGKTIGSYPAGGVRTLRRDDRLFYLASSDRKVHAVDIDSFKKVWTFEVERGTPTDILSLEDGLVVSTSMQFLYFVSKRDGLPLGRTDVGSGSGILSGLAGQNRTFYVFSNYGNLYRMEVLPPLIRRHLNHGDVRYMQ